MDRDGTLIEDKHYLDDPNDIQWFRGVFKCLKQLSENGFELIVVTNQSGVARGLMTEQVVHEIHTQMEETLLNHEISLTDIYYCPYLENGSVKKYSKKSPLRKPSPGMIYRARDEHGIRCDRSYMIGDKASDMKAGWRAGCETIFVRTGSEKDGSESASDSNYIHHATDDFQEATQTILSKQNSHV